MPPKPAGKGSKGWGAPPQTTGGKAPPPQGAPPHKAPAQKAPHTGPSQRTGYRGSATRSGDTPSTALVPFADMWFPGKCADCAQQRNVLEHKDYPEGKYCQECWAKFWANKDRGERNEAMRREREALKARGAIEMTVWNALRVAAKPIEVWEHYLHIDRSENMPEVMRKKLIFRYLYMILGEEAMSRVDVILSGAVVYCQVDLRPLVNEPRSRDVQIGSLKTQLELREVKKVTLDVTQGEETAMTVLNVVLGKAMEKGKLRRSGRIYCDHSRMRTYEDMVIIPGYFATFQLTPKGVSMVVHPRCRVQPTATALQWVSGPSRGGLIGREVSTMYGRKKLQYRIYKVDKDSNPTKTFLMKDGQSTTFLDYYKTKYGVEIKDKSQPLLWADKRGNIKLVPELLLVEQLMNESRRQLPSRCSKLPEELNKDVSAFVAERLSEPAVVSLLSSFGIAVTSKSMEQVQQKEMRPVAVQLQGSSDAPIFQDFAPQTTRLRFSLPRKEYNLLAWGSGALQAFQRIVDMNEQMGGPWKQRGDRIVEVQGHEGDDTFIPRCLESLPTKREQVLVLCALRDGHSSRGEDTYGKLKYELAQRGVVSHFMDLAKFNANKHPEPYLHNIMKNFTAKLGNPLWKVNIPNHVREMSGGTVYIAYDVYHDRRTECKESGALEHQRRSLAGFVAWYHRPDGTWSHYCETDMHIARQEILNPADDASVGGQSSRCEEDTQRITLRDFVKKVLDVVVKGGAMRRCVVYRDGVGETMFEEVRRSELPQVREALPSGVQLTFIVVQKRIHERILAGTKQGINVEWHNIPRGYVVESTPNTFLQVAVDCTLSTSKPVKYIVLEPGGLSMDSIQQLTFALCWMYTNWPGSIKVPFVLQCAHKLAFFHGTSSYLKPNVHPQLKCTPYYL